MRKRVGLYIPIREEGDSIHKGIMPSSVLRELQAHLESAGIGYTHVDLPQSDVRDTGICLGDGSKADFDLLYWFYILPEDMQSADMHCLKSLSQHMRVLPDPYAVERSWNKFSAHSLLAAKGIGVPEFCQFSSDDVESMGHLLEQWGKLLLKPVMGSFGHGVTMVKTRQELLDIVQYAASFHAQPIQIYCERFEPNDISRWISVVMIDRELVYGYRKRPERFVDGWKVYDPGRVGGAADYADPAPVVGLVKAACEVLGADMIGFDCIFSERLNKYLIVDENTIPGLYPDCFERAGKGSWAQHIARMIAQHLPKA